ncbi:hypothetical protein BJV74DRAFT_848665 [Russula compacta]|nr:hypothetical protein BJV74DRAFT_848665 [Russula compacta]
MRGWMVVQPLFYLVVLAMASESPGNRMRTCSSFFLEWPMGTVRLRGPRHGQSRVLAGLVVWTKIKGKKVGVTCEALGRAGSCETAWLQPDLPRSVLDLSRVEWGD